MSEALEESEKTCDEILRLLSGAPNLPSTEKEEIKRRISGVRDLLSKSKRKMMMRTTKGKQLAQQANADIADFEGRILELSKEADAKLVERLSKEAFEQLAKVEADAAKIVTFWQSYESVLT